MRKLPGYRPGDYVYVVFPPEVVSRLARSVGLTVVGLWSGRADLLIERSRFAEGDLTYVAWATERGKRFAKSLKAFEEDVLR